MPATELELKEFAFILEQMEIEKCRNNFYAFCIYMDPIFFTPDKKHLQQIAEAYQAVTDKQIYKLAISVPPRAGKSYITSLWCSWMLGRKADGSIMRNSYAADLAYTFSYDIRDIVQKDKHLVVFPHIKLKHDRKAIDDWALESSKRSAYFCAGVGGPITGKGCDIAGILDDPIKNIEEAMSETIIDKVWKWYTSTHLSRFETGCPEIHIATRWCKKDPIGRLTDQLSEFYNKEFTVIKIPALDECGKSFCEAIKTTSEYNQMKKVTDDFIWEAEYMQNPIEEKGLLFPTGELNRFSLSELEGKQPDGTIGYTDTADKGTDFLCSPIGKRYGDYTYITDVVFTQEGVEVTEPAVAQLIIDTKCKMMNVESNNGGDSFARNVQKIIQTMARDLKAKGTPQALQKASELNGYYVYFKPTTQNKETRILMNSGYIKQYFYFRNDYEPGSDYDKFMRYLTSYVKLGRNAHDDAPDAITGLAEYMQNEFYIPKTPTKTPVEELTGYYTVEELEDKGYTKWEIKQYQAKGIKPWGGK